MHQHQWVLQLPLMLHNLILIHQPWVHTHQLWVQQPLMQQLWVYHHQSSSSSSSNVGMRGQGWLIMKWVVGLEEGAGGGGGVEDLVEDQVVCLEEGVVEEVAVGGEAVVGVGGAGLHLG